MLERVVDHVSKREGHSPAMIYRPSLKGCRNGLYTPKGYVIQLKNKQDSIGVESDLFEVLNRWGVYHQCFFDCILFYKYMIWTTNYFLQFV